MSFTNIPLFCYAKSHSYIGFFYYFFLYVVSIYRSFLCICHCFWTWGILRMGKYVSYPEDEKSWTLKCCTVIFYLNIWQVGLTHLLYPASTYYFHSSCFLEWSHRLVLKTRIFAVIFIFFPSSTYNI